MDQYDVLRQLAEQGKLSREDIEKVVNEIQNPTPTTSRYRLIKILGLAKAYSYESFIEEFLDEQSDPMLASAALFVLCQNLGKTLKYLPRVLEFLRGVTWDEENDCKLIATSIAGEFLRKNSSPDLLEELLQLYETSNNPVLKEAAYTSLARSIGQEWKQIPTPSLKNLTARDINIAVLEAARKRLLDEKGQ